VNPAKIVTAGNFTVFLGQNSLWMMMMMIVMMMGG
jgi:hypothetical protein